MVTVYCYPNCSTCKKAIDYLNQNNVVFEYHNIKEDIPTYELLSECFKNNDYDIKRYFNTSGLVYKDLNMKEKFDTYTTDDLLKLLSTNGMLIKRPFLIKDGKVALGFKEKEFNQLLGISL